MDFDRAPIISDGDIGAFYNSNAGSQIAINVGDAISKSSGLLETLSYRSQEEFYFILRENKISVIAHYSDLNTPLVSNGIYAQIAYCEILSGILPGLKVSGKWIIAKNSWMA